MKPITSKFKFVLLAMCLQFAWIGASNAQCNVSIAGNFFPGTTNWYFAAIDSNQCLSPNATFVWNFGDNSDSVQGQNPTHTYNANGTYTVCCKITSNGANWTQCKTITVGSQPCNLYVTYTHIPNSNDVIFFVNDPGLCLNPQSTYAWTFGDNTTGIGSQVVHTYPTTAIGTYNVCVTITNGSVIMTPICIVISLAGPQIALAGKIVTAPNVCFNGPTTVEVIGMDNPLTFTTATSGLNDSCFYYIQVPADKSWIIRATPIGNGDYFPSYYGNQAYWSEATVIQPAAPGAYNLDIQLQTSLWSIIGTGNGTLSGMVGGNGTLVTTNFNGNTITTTFNAQRSNAIILNSANEPIGFAGIGADGTFSFPNLPMGQYFLRIESPKVNSATFSVNVTAAQPNPTIAVTATGSGINILTGNAKLLKGEEISLVPNPAHHHISVTGVIGTISVINAQGQVVMETIETKLNIESLSSGIYTIKAMNAAKEVVTTRFIKN